MRFSQFFGIGMAMLAGSAFALPKSADLVADMGLGYNIGNTMEAPGNPTAWGNTLPTAEYVKAIKAAGFNTVRIPCAWDTHANNGVIDAEWMNTVKAVVDLVVGEGMYAILNAHWDEGWLEDHVFDGSGYDKEGKPVTSSAATVAAKQESYWKQIATAFASYDEHVIFASANEPGVNDPWINGTQWEFTAARMQVLNQFHEACIKGVRNAGGENNKTRTIIVQAPRTESELALSLLAPNMPNDPAGNGYLMAEFHYYPYQYSLMENDEDWGKVYYYYTGFENPNDKEHTVGWNVYSNSVTDHCTKSSTEKIFKDIHDAFVTKGIPVVIGELGVIKRLDDLSGDNLKLHLQGRAAWYGDVATYAKQYGLIPCVWDTGDEGNRNFTFIRRQTDKFPGNVGDIVDIESLNSMRKAYGMTALSGNTIDGQIKPEIPAGTDMVLQEVFKSVTTDSSEVGTMRINVKKDWSAYTKVTFEALVNVEDAPIPGEEYGWHILSFFMMTGSDWTWSDFNITAEEIGEGWNTYEVPFAELTNSPDLKSVNAIGLNMYGSALSGYMRVNNIILWKADGTCDTLETFDKKKPQTEGIITASLVEKNSPFTTSVKPMATLLNKMLVNVQAGSVMVQFNAANAGAARAMLMNTKGEVISSAKFDAHKGANTVELASNYRGPAMLVVKQGSQMQTQKVILK